MKFLCINNVKKIKSNLIEENLLYESIKIFINRKCLLIIIQLENDTMYT